MKKTKKYDPHLDPHNGEKTIDRLKRKVKYLRMKRESIDKKILFYEADRFGLDLEIKDLQKAIKSLRKYNN